MNLICKLVAIAATLSFANVSTAYAAIYCLGVPSGVYTQNDGSVVIQGPWRNDWTQICNIKTTWKNVDPVICLGWFSEVANAVTQQKPVTIYYSEAGMACETIPTYWSSPAPYYVMLRKE